MQLSPPAESHHGRARRRSRESICAQRGRFERCAADSAGRGAAAIGPAASNNQQCCLSLSATAFGSAETAEPTITGAASVAAPWQHADASSALHSLTLPANPSSDQSGRVLAENCASRDAVIARWPQSAAAVQKEQILSYSQETGPNSNPLQAAFLRPTTTSSRSAAQEASARVMLLQVTTKKETGSQTAHSVHRSVLATGSAELHSALLAQLPSPSTAAAPTASTVDQPSTGTNTAQDGFYDATDPAWLPTAAQQVRCITLHCRHLYVHSHG
jgi:hypothetical protein